MFELFMLKVLPLLLLKAVELVVRFIQLLMLPLVQMFICALVPVPAASSCTIVEVWLLILRPVLHTAPLSQCTPSNSVVVPGPVTENPDCDVTEVLAKASVVEPFASILKRVDVAVGVEDPMANNVLA